MNDDRKKSDKLKDLAYVSGAGYLGVKGKDRVLGLSTMYHGTSKENAKSIRKNGLQTRYSNKEGGATKWLANFIKEETKKELDGRTRPLTYTKPTYRRNYPAGMVPTEYWVGSLEATGHEVRYNPSSDKFVIDRGSGWKRKADFKEKPPKKLWRREFDTIDEVNAYNKRLNAVSTARLANRVTDWSKDQVFASGLKPVGNFYAHMSDNKVSSGFMRELVNSLMAHDAAIGAKDPTAQTALITRVKKFIKKYSSRLHESS